jgi:hypothetical protein
VVSAGVGVAATGAGAAAGSAALIAATGGAAAAPLAAVGITSLTIGVVSSWLKDKGLKSSREAILTAVREKMVDVKGPTFEDPDASVASPSEKKDKKEKPDESGQPLRIDLGMGSFEVRKVTNKDGRASPDDIKNFVRSFRTVKASPKTWVADSGELVEEKYWKHIGYTPRATDSVDSSRLRDGIEGLASELESRKLMLGISTTAYAQISGELPELAKAGTLIKILTIYTAYKKEQIPRDLFERFLTEDGKKLKGIESLGLSYDETQLETAYKLFGDDEGLGIVGNRRGEKLREDGTMLERWQRLSGILRD